MVDLFVGWNLAVRLGILHNTEEYVGLVSRDLGFGGCCFRVMDRCKGGDGGFLDHREVEVGYSDPRYRGEG